LTAGKPITCRGILLDCPLPTQFSTGSHLFLHGQSGGAPVTDPHGQYRLAARRVPRRAAASPVRDRRNRNIARPFACAMDIAGRDANFPVRRRLIKAEFSRGLPREEPVSASRLRKRRVRGLAAPLLGAHNPRRSGFCAARRLHSFQSRQTRACRPRPGLAVLVVSPHGSTRSLSGGLGGGRRRFGRHLRRANPASRVEEKKIRAG
jgi:hypothetical protein